ncbi:hypothetical protein JRQ81_017090 [Phrynocephalus forsythii]|uniref:F-box/LRR-repeat protein 15-like leucin rich repeat domain-containing protein n=1 Tax=Phrynocephalus forsythii TaxID=171643 RepID=A0A9Q0XTH5_9SAUR|nr:hypothetical protein JRQ81_017090 [Phrynocephalus forsythii]
MPRRKSVQSLQKLCLENVAGNMQGLWAKDYTENYLDEYQFCYIEGPFSQLAASLVHELLRLKGKRLTRAMLHLLLVPQLTELSLRACPKLVNNAIAQMITLRCKNLSSLDLEGCSRIPISALVNLMEGLPRLTKLYLEETQCNTQVLSAVGSCCRRLRELNISGCKRISSESLFHLAFDPTAGTFCCPDLQILSVDGLESKPYCDDLLWALAFLLLALPSLVFLENEFVAEAVCLIHDRQFEGAQVPAGFPSMQELVRRKMSAAFGAEPEGQLTLPLREVLEVSEPFLPSVRAVCPHLAKTAVLMEEHPGLNPGFLLPWRQLTDLTLDCWDMKALADLLPLTASLGAQLQALSVDGFSLGEGPCVAILLSHCPNLQKFSASLFYSTRLSGGQGGTGWDAALAPCQFPQLRDVILSFSDVDDSVPPPQVPALRASLACLLARSPCLESVLLTCLPFSLDSLLQEVLEDTSLPCLGYLALVKCEVSSPTVHRLLSLDNPLNKLVLEECPDIHRKDYAELLRRVRRERLDLQVTWK